MLNVGRTLNLGPFSLLIAFAAAGCARTWVELPPFPLAADACVPHDACDWSRIFDDLVVFQVDGAAALDSPLFSPQGDVRGSDDCRVVAPGILISGNVERSARGLKLTRIIVPGDSTLTPDDFSGWSLLLAAVAKVDDNTGLLQQPWPRVRDGLVTFDPAGDCDTELNNVPVERLFDETRDCDTFGDLIDRDTLTPGAICYPPELE